MTEQEQIEKIMCMFNKLKRGDYCVDNCYGCCGDEKIDITCHDVVVNFIQSLMQAGYGDISEYKAEREKLGSQIKVLKQRLNDKYIEIDNLNRDYRNAFERLKSQQQEIERLKAENEQLKVKLEKNPLAIKQKIMEEDDYELTEREQATLFLDRMESDVEILHDIVENLDELLGKGIDEYIKGIDGVEGLKDMWERSAVMEFAEKLRKRLTENRVSNDNVVINANYEIDELLKEYE